MRSDEQRFVLKAFFKVSLLIECALCVLQAKGFFVRLDSAVFEYDTIFELYRVGLFYEWLIIMVSTLLPGVVILFWGNQTGMLVTSLLWAFYMFILLILLKTFGLNGPVAAPVIGSVISVIRVMGWGSSFLEEEKNLIKSAFSHFLEPSVVEMLLKSPHIMDQCGTRKTVTVLFADLRGFSGICETKPPEVVTLILKEYFSAMIAISRENKGTVDKLIGDGIMVVFGYPIPLEQHANNALVTAKEMRAVMKKLQAGWIRKFDVNIGLGIGINTDEVVVGTIGSDQFYDYTVLGAGVNLASRLEAECPSGEIHVSRNTYELVKNNHQFDCIGARRFRSLLEKQDVYKVK